MFLIAKDFGEIPGGKNEICDLLYPFYKNYPLKLWSQYRWWKNAKLKRLLSALNKKFSWITIIDRLGAPGDALITATLIRCIKKRYPNLKVNCITPHPNLLTYDPSINSLNSRETFYSFDSSYWDFIENKETKRNIIEEGLGKLHIFDYNYKCQFYLSDEEIKWANTQLLEWTNNKPILAICTKSKEEVKNWPENHWIKLVQLCLDKFNIIHLGDDREPILKGVFRLAGLYSMRESAALLSKANYFIGPDSLLMHVANGLDIPSVIIFGGSRPVGCFGYKNNINLGSNPQCSPCWIHSGHEVCSEQLKCLHSITVMDVFSSITRLTNKQ